MVKILYFTNQEEDYLADGVLIGLLNNPDVEVSQLSVKNILYKKYEGAYNIRGKGFTLYYLIQKHAIEAETILNELVHPESYQVIIFSSIQRQFKQYRKYLPLIKNKRVWVLDGEDTPGMYPFHGYYWRRPFLWFLPKAHTRFLYFKREWTPETMVYLTYKLVPKFVLKYFPVPKNLRPISFSIPEEKICTDLPIKTKLFPKHIVDAEVASHVSGSFTSYAFESEELYYMDLQQSSYGITMKRSGWDCLRHYEIAANGAVICFRDLDKKPVTCAPHGLVHGINCISYTSYENLIQIINGLGKDQYHRLQSAAYQWAKENTCEKKAKEMLQHNGLT
jgi:hypothetical protein